MKLCKTGARTTASALLWLGLLSAGAPSLRATAVVSDAPAVSSGEQDQQGATDPLERLRAMLKRPGPDGRTDRERAVAQLLEMPRPEAHRALQDHLRLVDDPEQLRLSILDALARHLLGNQTAQFGGAAPDLRRQLLTGYLGACAPLWANAPVVEEGGAAPVRAAARRALQRVPARELDAAATTLMATLEPKDRAEVIRCLADMQQTLLARTIARQLEAPEAVVRAAAQKALDLLIYPDKTIRTEAEFAAWSLKHGDLAYVDLVQRSARLGPRAYQQLRDQMEQMRVDGAREFVAVHIERRTGIDWEAVQNRTTSDGPAVLDACLEALQAALSRAPAIDGTAAARHAFFRSLLDRLAQVPDSQQQDVQRRRALLLEVAAYLIRPEEAEVANEIRSLLLAELGVAAADGQIAALRGLRRFPSAEARQALVQRGRALFADLPGNYRQIQVILDTLSSITEPRWMAPGPDAADKLDWVALVDQSCRTAPDQELRDRGLLLAQTLDSSKRYVPEAFQVLRQLAEDVQLDTKFRSSCLIYLDAWRADDELAPAWLAAMQGALADTAAGLRRQAAESLVRLREVNDTRRAEWLPATLVALRERLLVEDDAAVLGALAGCAQELGREPGMAAPAIAALKHVLAAVGHPAPKEQEFRVAPLLPALAAVAAGSKIGSGQWVEACEPLLLHEKRKGLRQVLQTQKAIELTKDVVASDAKVADAARLAMTYLIGAAVLVPSDTDWRSESNKEEARHVRMAFAALDQLDAEARLDAPNHRVLRVTVDLALGKGQEVVERISGWLAAPDPGDAGHCDRLRLIAAEAELSQKRPAEALAFMEARAPEAASEPSGLAVSMRIARALAASDAARAAAVFEKALRATSSEDPLYRARLLDWLRCSLRVPELKESALAEAEAHASMFEGAECPEKLRTEFAELLRQNQGP